jgi:hypothetical protein
MQTIMGCLIGTKKLLLHLRLKKNLGKDKLN